MKPNPVYSVIDAAHAKANREAWEALSDSMWEPTDSSLKAEARAKAAESAKLGDILSRTPRCL